VRARAGPNGGFPWNVEPSLATLVESRASGEIAPSIATMRPSVLVRNALSAETVLPDSIGKQPYAPTAVEAVSSSAVPSGRSDNASDGRTEGTTMGTTVGFAQMVPVSTASQAASLPSPLAQEIPSVALGLADDESGGNAAMAGTESYGFLQASSHIAPESERDPEWAGHDPHPADTEELSLARVRTSLSGQLRWSPKLRRLVPMKMVLEVGSPPCVDIGMQTAGGTVEEASTQTLVEFQTVATQALVECQTVEAQTEEPAGMSSAELQERLMDAVVAIAALAHEKSLTNEDLKPVWKAFGDCADLPWSR